MSSVSNENSVKSSEESDQIDNTSESSSIYENNETILKIKELLEILTTEQENVCEDIKSFDTVSLSNFSVSKNDTSIKNDLESSKSMTYSYVELLALYESELKYRTECK